MTDYQDQQRKAIPRTKPAQILDITDNEIWQTDKSVENVLVFYFPVHKFYRRQQCLN